MPLTPATRGIVFYGDVLGYRDLIASDQIQETAALITDVLLALPREVKDEAIQKLAQTDLPQFIQPVQWRVISDAIILTLPNPEDGVSWKRWFAALILVSSLTWKMIGKGLPLRGAITCGNYFVNELCFAGKPFVDAYEVSQDCDWAGVVLLPDAEKCLQETGRNYFPVVIPFVAPTKARSRAIRLCINWPLARKTPVPPREFLLRAFLEHGKTWSENLTSKLTNTEAFLIHSQIVSPGLLKKAKE